MKEILKEQEKRKGLIAAICAGDVHTSHAQVHVGFLQKPCDGIIFNYKILFQILSPSYSLKGIRMGIFGLGGMKLVSFRNEYNGCFLASPCLWSVLCET